MMPENKERKAQTPPQKWRMALTDSANFGEQLVESDKAHMTAAYKANKRKEPTPVGLTREQYANGAKAHRAIAAVCADRDDAHGQKQHARHMAIADDMESIATAAWTPKKAAAAAKAAADAAKAKADAIAAIKAQMAALGVNTDDLSQ